MKSYIKDMSSGFISEIIEVYLSGISSRSTAEKFNISQTLVIKILKLNNIVARKQRLENKEIVELNKKEYHFNYRRSNISYRYNHGKHSAKVRELEFSLSFDEYSNIIKNKCYYCDDKLSSTREIAGFGIDRLNNNIGYEINNCVSCCSFCNKLKMDQLTPEQAKQAVKAIINLSYSYEEDNHIW